LEEKKLLRNRPRRHASSSFLNHHMIRGTGIELDAYALQRKVCGLLEDEDSYW
jgi:hypothetical protein